MQRKRLVWKLREGELVFADQTLVAGLVPVIPIPAPDGQQYDDANRAFARAMLLEEQGAAFLVLGAEILVSGKPLLTAEEQTRRIIPVLKKLRGQIGIPVAVATTRAETAARALDAGAEIIFDQSAASFEPNIAKVVADASGVLVLGHMRGTPDRWAQQAPTPDPIATVLGDLDAGIHRARMVHLRNDQLAVEPGFALGKRRDENVAVAARVFLLNRFEIPVLVNVSTPGVLNEDTPGSSLAVATASVLGAAHALIAFDVPATIAAASVADAIGRVKAYEATVLPKEKIRETPGFGKRPLGRESRPPRDDTPPPNFRDSATSADSPPADTPREQRRDFDNRPPRDDRRAGDDRPPRRPFRDDSAPRGDRPPRKNFGPRDDRAPRGDRPPRKNFGPRDDQAPGSDRPPRKNFGPRGDRPPLGGSRPPRRDGPPTGGGRPPRRDGGPPSGGARPPKRFGPPKGPRGPRRDD